MLRWFQFLHSLLHFFFFDEVFLRRGKMKAIERESSLLEWGVKHTL